MIIRVGDVIEDAYGLSVVTEVTNGVITNDENLQDYIMRNTLVLIDGEWNTAYDVIQMRCENYLKTHRRVKL